MPGNAIVAIDSERSRVTDSSSLGEPLDFDVRGLGRRLPRTDAPEGWLKKIARRREGKVWVGFFHLWTTDSNGRRVRQKKEKTLGAASMPRHEAQSKLAEYIEKYTGRLKKTGHLFAKHVIPVVGSQPPREVYADITTAAP